MTLIDAFKEEFVIMDKQRVSDGEGGFVTAWVESAPFVAALILDNSMTARIGEKQGVTAVYTLTTAKGLGLDFHDVFKRVSDGTTFRVTSHSKDKQTPDVASFQFEQVSAEEWKLE